MRKLYVFLFGHLQMKLLINVNVFLILYYEGGFLFVWQACVIPVIAFFSSAFIFGKCMSILTELWNSEMSTLCLEHKTEPVIL